jgi:hypothetical protein
MGREASVFTKHENPLECIGELAGMTICLYNVELGIFPPITGKGIR